MSMNTGSAERYIGGFYDLTSPLNSRDEVLLCNRGSRLDETLVYVYKRRHFPAYCNLAKSESKLSIQKCLHWLRISACTAKNKLNFVKCQIKKWPL